MVEGNIFYKPSQYTYMLVLGHKGYSAKYPENTIIAFQKAIEYGADGVELDVWLSKDGRVVVNHDPTLKEHYNANIKIKESTLEELRFYKYEDQTIPTLEEVYEALPESAIINVEIKDVDATIPALNIAKKYNALKRTLFSSFHEKALELLREEGDEIKIALLIGKTYKMYEFIKLIRKLKLNYVNPPIMGEKIVGRRSYRMYLRILNWMGVKIIMWTVDNTEDFKPYVKLTHGVITNEVEKMLEYLGRSREKEKRN